MNVPRSTHFTGNLHDHENEWHDYLQQFIVGRALARGQINISVLNIGVLDPV
jgi:hypothetical protein